MNMFPGPDIYWQILPLFVFPLTKCRVTVRIEQEGINGTCDSYNY